MRKIAKILLLSSLLASVTFFRACLWPCPWNLRPWKNPASTHGTFSLGWSSSHQLYLAFSRTRIAILSSSLVFLHFSGRMQVFWILCSFLRFPSAFYTLPWFSYVHPFASHRCLSNWSYLFCSLSVVRKRTSHPATWVISLLPLLTSESVEEFARAVERKLIALSSYICPN